MACAAATAGFTVEVFMEKHQIRPGRIGRVLGDLAMTWPRAVFVRQKDACQSARKLTCDLLERHHVSGAGWTLNFERFAVEEVITLERFDDEKIDREPNRSAPV